MSLYNTLLIDLDQTIYPASSGIWEDVIKRIQSFLEVELKLSAQEAIRRRHYYFETYGTTLRGLQLEAKVDPLSYMAFIHDVQVERKIQRDPALRGLLEAIKIPKYIFTNASSDHAERVLRHLGIEDCFDGIIDIIRLEYLNKPDPEAYRRALHIAGNPDPEACVLLDDTLMNLKTGAQMGMTTVHVGSTQNDEFAPDYKIASIHHLLEVLPELKRIESQAEDRRG